MKILFICQQYIHAARWIGQLKDSGNDIYVFDCLDAPIHEDLKWTNYTTNWSKRKLPYLKGEDWLKKHFPKLFYLIEPFLKLTAADKLVELIKVLKPDLVHSLEMQSQTYHLLKAKKIGDFKWAYSSWGSDLYFYQNQKNHQHQIKKVLSNLDYLFTDNSRDINSAIKLGFKGQSMGVFPGGGGYDLKKLQPLIKPFADRKLILIKGYHHWAGRALPVLNALKSIKDSLKGYKIYVYAAHPVVVERICQINKETNLKIDYSQRQNEFSHSELLSKFGQAKIAVGNSVSDGIPNTLLEAIIMGAFPIQSNPGDVSKDYIKDGINGFLIQNPEDENEIASKILCALNDENLIKKAQLENKNLSQKLEYLYIQKEVLKAYKTIQSQL